MVSSISSSRFVVDIESSPLAPTKMTICIDGELTFPGMDGVSSLLIRSQADALFCKSACASTSIKLSEACVRLTSHRRLENDFPGLFDELSQYSNFDVFRDVVSQKSKTDREYSVMRSLPSTKALLQNANVISFIDLIRKIHRKNRKGLDTFRTTSVRIAPDDRGNTIIFLHHSLCIPLMEGLCVFLSRNIAAHPVLCTVVAYVAVIHAHPFTDGNGRTARTLFNIIIRDHAHSSHFVPIKAISLMSRGGFFIRLRRAMYESDWGSIQEFFSSAIRLSDWSQRNDREHA